MSEKRRTFQIFLHKLRKTQSYSSSLMPRRSNKQVSEIRSQKIRGRGLYESFEDFFPKNFQNADFFWQARKIFWTISNHTTAYRNRKLFHLVNYLRCNDVALWCCSTWLSSAG